MKPTICQGIVLSRTNFGEADKIITLLTPSNGKISVLAKGVRKSKSKIAGGVELFSISEISYVRGRGELGTLISARLKIHYGNIVNDLDRTMLGYDLIKLLNKTTEDEPGTEYFDLLQEAFVSLDHAELHTDIIKLWFYAQLLRIAGHTPNLKTDIKGKILSKESSYSFDYEEMAFVPNNNGSFKADHIKFLRLALSGNNPRILQQITGVDKLLLVCLDMLQTILPSHIRT